METYLTFLKLSFLQMLAYRMRYFVGIITYLLFVSVNYFIWQAVYENSASVLNGFTLPQMITYVSIGWISRSLYHSNIDYTIDQHVKNGTITNYLMRPVDFQTFMISQAAGESIFRLLFFTLPIGVVIFLIFPISFPSSITNALAFVISCLLAFTILATINFMVGLISFSLKSITGVVHVKYYLVQLLSGLLLPLSFFPNWAEKIIELLPFKFISYVPLQIYLGKISGSAIISQLCIGLAWSVILILLGRAWWKKCVKKLTIQGG